MLNHAWKHYEKNRESAYALKSGGGDCMASVIFCSAKLV